MKSLLLKSIAVGLLSMVAMTSTFAAVQCKVHNARGQVWFGTAQTRAGATANAMRFCVRNSTYASNCVVDGCQGAGPAPVMGWQCNVENARGQVWVGTGPTRAAAASNAVGFCAAHSAYARNCVVNGCSQR